MVQRAVYEQQMGKERLMGFQVRQEKQAVGFHFPLYFKKAVHFWSPEEEKARRRTLRTVASCDEE